MPSRLVQEYRSTQHAHQNEILLLQPLHDADLSLWQARLAGCEGTPYAGGVWELELRIPEHYPFRPPHVRFLTRIVHPNIHLATGEICLDLLREHWSPAYTLLGVCIAIRSLLSSPHPDSPLNVDAALLLRTGDTTAYNSLVALYRKLYAQGS